MLDPGAIATQARASGLAEVADELAALALPGWRLIAEQGPAPAVAASKLGGMPDLPDGVAWPVSRYDATPMAFVGQIAVHDLAAGPTWPGPQGELLLSCFCDLDPDAVSAYEGGAGVVVPISDVSSVTRRSRPDDLIAVRELNETPIVSRPEVSLPTIGVYAAEVLAPLGLDYDGEREHLFEDYAELQRWLAWEQGFRDGHVEAPLLHRLLGHPRFMQGDVLWAFALAHGEEDAGAAAAAQRWRLLLQVTSDPWQLGVQWGGGMYFGLPAEDLAAGVFTAVEACTDSD